MPVVLGHSSARNGWMRTGVASSYADVEKLLPYPQRKKSCDEYFTRYVPRLGDATNKELSQLGFSLTGLDILTCSHANRRKLLDARCHSHSYILPPGSIMSMSRRVAIASPELTFLELASEPGISFEKLIKFGYEICGRYALTPIIKDGAGAGEEDISSLGRDVQETELVQVKPRTTKEQIVAFLDEMESLNAENPRLPAGIQRARRALKYVIGVVESPIETDIAMLEFAPAHLGGNAIPSPECNALVEVPADMVPIVHRKSFRCDFLWRDTALVLEVNGSGHGNAREMRRDAEKYNALRSLGYNVLLATGEHVYSRKHTDALANQLRGYLGVKPPRTRYNHEGRKTRLRAELGV